MVDLSALRTFEVVGPDARRCATTRDLCKPAVGQVVCAAMGVEYGGMIDGGTIFRLGQDISRWICGDSFGGIWMGELATCWRPSS